MIKYLLESCQGTELIRIPTHATKPVPIHSHPSHLVQSPTHSRTFFNAVPIPTSLVPNLTPSSKRFVPGHSNLHSIALTFTVKRYVT